jgi:uncharacterized repeat protein (TIGR03803 family)
MNKSPRSLIQSARTAVDSIAVLLLTVVAAHAQYGYDRTHLHSFSGHDGLGPEGALIQATDGNFYGTTYGEFDETSGSADAAVNGTVFKLTPQGVLTTLHVFAGIDGAHPQAPLVQLPNGILYGTTTGGYNGLGITVFKIATDGSGFATLAHGSQQTGLAGATLTAGKDGNLYGTDRLGGSISDGAIFKVTPAGAVSIIYSFQGDPDGEFPNGPLVQAADGDFYGVTGGGGQTLQGTIFKISPSGAYRSLYTLKGTDGAGPNGLVQASNGVFYGTAAQGGNPNYPPSGTLFKVTSGGAFTKLVDLGEGFGVEPSRAVDPKSGLIVGPDGALYGTGLQGGETGTANGGVFRLSLSGEYSPVYAFDGKDGSGPYGSLLLGKDGNLYGTTSGYVAQTEDLTGGDQDGTIFELSPVGGSKAPTVDVAATIPKVTVGSGKTGIFTLTLSATAGRALTLKYTLSGSAINGTDYKLLTGTSQIKAGAKTVEIKIVPRGDLDGAAKKTVTLTLEAGTDYTVGKVGAAQVKIVKAP